MKNTNSSLIQQGLVDLIINLTTSKTSTHSRLSSLLGECQQTLERDVLYSQITDLFYQINRKLPSRREDAPSALCLTFKLISNETNSIIRTDTWFINAVPSPRTPSMEDGDTMRSLKLLLSDILQTSSKLAESDVNWEHSNCSIVYQITTKITRQSLSSSNKIQLTSTILDTEYQVQVYTKTLLEQTDGGKTFKKSMCTVGSVSEEKEEKEEGRGRKLSFYSYYDEENDVTFVSNESLSMGDGENIEDIFCEEPVDSDGEYEFEMLMSEDDSRTLAFKQSLQRMEGLSFQL